MKRMEVPALAMIIIVWLGAQAEAQTPCPELVRLRSVATKAWKQAMRAPPSERCGALYAAERYIMPPWPQRRHSNTQMTIASHATFLSHC